LQLITRYLSGGIIVAAHKDEFQQAMAHRLRNLHGRRQRMFWPAQTLILTLLKVSSDDFNVRQHPAAYEAMKLFSK
jgi:hypothetical protein